MLKILVFSVNVVLFLLFGLIVHVGEASGATVRVQVFTPAGSYASGATVCVGDTSDADRYCSGTADSQGKYTCSGVPVGQNKKATATKSDYRGAQSTFSINNASDTRDVQVVLLSGQQQSGDPSCDGQTAPPTPTPQPAAQAPPTQMLKCSAQPVKQVSPSQLRQIKQQPPRLLTKQEFAQLLVRRHGWTTDITTDNWCDSTIASPLGNAEDAIAGNSIRDIVTNSNVKVRSDNLPCTACHPWASSQSASSFCGKVNTFNTTNQGGAGPKPQILKNLLTDWNSRNCPN